MRALALALAATATLCGGASARDPLTDLVHNFFHYEPPPPPRGYDCNAVAASVGPEATWYGRFSGKVYQVNDRYRPFFADGCFPSEAECRAWQQWAVTYAFGPIDVTSCRRGVTAR
jgi:hypothetical protein